ncbi:MAG: cytochrome c biogenesis protein ResB [Phycisphaerales bacterium]|nr:cytochrome c biogenesis protein ResB [Phycisphaerales bacterium]
MTTPSTGVDTPQASSEPSNRGGGPIRAIGRSILDLFSSVRFGIILMILLFIYMSIGSAGVLYPARLNIFSPANWKYQQMRQWRLFEMTEFEWFHWWPFDLLMLLIAITLVVTTLRRIRLSVVNLGVWMIHSGIITLIIGSLIYFGTKVEGDTFLSRRAVVLEVLDDDGQPTGAPQRISVFPGNKITLDRGNERFEVMVASTDPDWELLTGEDAGERAYSVSLFIKSPERSFIRQVIAGHPDYTEDLVSTEDPQQPFQRSVKINGEKIIEPRLRISLEYEPQKWFYLSNQLSKNWALYLREKGTTDWVQRPIPSASPLDPDKEGVPLYGDYIADPSSLNVRRNRRLPRSDALDVEIPPVAENDPLPGLNLKVDSYLRYASMQSRWEEGASNAPINPMVNLDVRIPEQPPRSQRLVALDPAQSSSDNGAIVFRYVTTEDEFLGLQEPARLKVSVPSLGFTETRPLSELAPAMEWAVGTSGYSISLFNVQNDIVFSNGSSSVAFVDITSPDGEAFRRWVFSDPTLTRDLDESGSAPVGQEPTLRAEDLVIEYIPGRGDALLTLTAGPDLEQLRVIQAVGDGSSSVSDLKIGGAITFGGGVSIGIAEYFPRALIKDAPMVVPPSQRQREAGNLMSWIRMELPGGGHRWLQFQKYLFDTLAERLSRYDFAPTTVEIRGADGKWKEIEMVFSRQRLPLPSEVVLEKFEIDTNVGGFTGESGSIRDYRSRVRFIDGKNWTDPMPISMNKPVEHDGLWFFQSQWDPPEPARSADELGSKGLNYTVLGVGNRNGVVVQLVGCIIAVIGMIYAFYIKPAIKRRRRDQVLVGLKESDS